MNDSNHIFVAIDIAKQFHEVLIRFPCGKLKKLKIAKVIKMFLFYYSILLSSIVEVGQENLALYLASFLFYPIFHQIRTD